MKRLNCVSWSFLGLCFASSTILALVLIMFLYVVTEFKAVNTVLEKQTEIIERIDKLDDKFRELNRALEASKNSVLEQDAIAEYLKEAKGEVFSWWPAKTQLDYANLYSTIEFVLGKCPIEIPDKRGLISLLIETIATESNFGAANKQVGGVALGVIQMMPDTFRCIQDNYLKYNPELVSFILQFKDNKLLDLENLQMNLQYQIAYAVVHFARFNAHTEDLTTRKSRWAVYKQYWNTHRGKATEEAFFNRCTLYVSDYYTDEIRKVDEIVLGSL